MRAQLVLRRRIARGQVGQRGTWVSFRARIEASGINQGRRHFRLCGRASGPVAVARGSRGAAGPLSVRPRSAHRTVPKLLEIVLRLQPDLRAKASACWEEAAPGLAMKRQRVLP